jgi:hypothetical protein
MAARNTDCAQAGWLGGRPTRPLTEMSTMPSSPAFAKRRLTALWASAAPQLWLQWMLRADRVGLSSGAATSSGREQTVVAEFKTLFRSGSCLRKQKGLERCSRWPGRNSNPAPPECDAATVWSELLIN